MERDLCPGQDIGIMGEPSKLPTASSITSAPERASIRRLRTIACAAFARRLPGVPWPSFSSWGLGCAFNQIVNMGGESHDPCCAVQVVNWCMAGPSTRRTRRSGATKVVCPATYHRQGAHAAIRDNNPVRILRAQISLRFKEEIPGDDYVVPRAGRTQCC